MNIDRWISNRFLLIPLLALPLLAACTHNASYRTDTELCTSNDEQGIIEQCASNSVQKFTGGGGNDGGYTLGFIEFDDQGQIQNYQQVDALHELMQDITSREDVIVLVFVHGWKHNAHAGPEPGEEDNNITRFRDVLSSVSRTEALQNPDAPREVVGVYLGWRGLSVTLTGIKELSFWERKNTAHKVGGGAITEALLTLDNLVAARNSGQGTDKPKSRLIVIGHSFGGAAVYSAVNQVLLERYMKSDCIGNNGCSVRGFGDLVVLMNPAFEAMRFSALRNASDRADSFAKGQLPVLAILTSEADYATKYAFPAGRVFSTFFEQERPDRDQEAKNRNAVGHYAPYQTHRLSALPTKPGEPKQARALADQLQTFLLFAKQWDEQTQTDLELPDIGVRFTKTGDTDRFNPYLSIYVDGALIPDHNEIYDPRVTEFLRQLIMLSIQEDDAKVRAMQRSSMTRSLEKLRAQ